MMLTYSLRIDYPPPPRVEIDFGPLVLAPDGLGIVDFGDEPIAVIEVLTLLLGEPTTDSGWEGGSITNCTGTLALKIRVISESSFMVFLRLDS